MKIPSTPLEWVLRTWPQLRNQFWSHSVVAEAELQAFIRQTLPVVSPETWPAVRAGLVRNHLLYEADDATVSFEPVVVASPFKPELAPTWRTLWEYLQTRLALPMGCLWSTRWLQPYLPSLPLLLVIEVNWAEVSQARNLLQDYFYSNPIEKPGSTALGSGIPQVLVRSWQRNAPVCRIKGVPVARLEKLLVDAGRLPELADVVSSAALSEALSVLCRQYTLDRSILLKYAAQYHLSARWEELLTTMNML